MSLKASNKVDTNRYELTITVPAAEFDSAMTKVFQRENKKISEDGIIVYTGQARLSSNTYGELSDVCIVGIENKKAEKIKKFIKDIL